MFLFTFKYQLQNHCDGTVSGNKVTGVSVTAPQSLVAALVGNFSERVGSQSYIHVYFKIHFQNKTLLRC